MTIYLYVKTHNQTGLKYLGKTIQKDPHKYPGSGQYWIDHLNKHGYDYQTEILMECDSKEQIQHWGLYYSNLFDVVNAKDHTGKKIWANLKPEYGDGDDPERIKQKALARVANGTHNFLGPTSPNIRRLADGTHNLLGKNNPVHKLYASGSHYVQSEEFSKFMSVVQKRELEKGTHPLQKGNRPTAQCPHCGKVGDAYVMKRWHFDKCKLAT
jgi:hypothetical protein